MTDKIRKIFLDVGIKDIGFLPFEAIKEHLLPCNAQNRLPKGAKTVIMCAFPYKVKEQPPENISRYAAVPDYHTVVKEYLERAVVGLKKTFPQNCFEIFVDNSPIPEVYAACLSGLGKMGKNGLLITKKYGSFVFLGEVVCDLRLNLPNREIEYCSLCGDCERACSIGLCKEHCLSAVSQQKKITNEQAEALRENKIIWGCDMCAENCPDNRNAELTYIKEFKEGYRDRYSLGEDGTDRAYNWRGEAVIKRNYVNLYREEN